VNRSWTGPLVTGLIGVGVVAVLVFNFQPNRPSVPVPPVPSTKDEKPKPNSAGPAPSVARGVPEHPIGEPVEKNHIRIVAVWLEAVKMEGMDATPAAASDLIHVEADIKATEDNPNGFAKDEFVPYLKVAYSIVPAKGGPAIEKGELTPMVAWDGLHYGANIVMPKAGDYRLIYDIEPPSAGGLGRHSDPATGVAPWWPPFRASFDWTVEPNPASPAKVGSR
jgi:uncharacterized protein involved in high-affinity Fe2+ transport